MERIRALVYPYDRESVCLFRYNNLNKMHDAVGAVSPNGWGLTGRDIGNTDGGEELGVIVRKSFEEFSHNDYDAVLLADSQKPLDFEKLIYPKLKSEAEKGKHIICYKKLSEEHKIRVRDLCTEKGIVFVYQVSNTEYEKISAQDIQDIRTPVVFVIGLAERTNKFDIQLSLREGFAALKYRVSQIGTKSYCEAFGFHSFPSFMADTSLTDCERVVMFNRYVKSIELNEKPDVIIIGIPGGVMAINQFITSGFGITAYLVSQAVKPDATVFTTLYEEYPPEFFNEIDMLLKYRFGYMADCFNFSNIKIDYQETKQTGQLDYMLIEGDFVNKKVEALKLDKPCFNILDSKQRRSMYDYTINLLQGEECIQDIL